MLPLSPTMRSAWRLPLRISSNLLQDQSGLAFSSDMALFATVLVIGLLAALASVRDAVICELSDTGGFVQDVSQNYEVSGLGGPSVQSSGMSFNDGLDPGDDSEDVSGQADNCIGFNIPPKNELAVASPVGLRSSITFESDATDGSGANNGGTLIGDAAIVGGALVLDGDGDFVAIDDSSDINLGTHGQRTIALDFLATEASSRQVLYEEGANVRGLVIYIDGGRLYIGGWNIPTNESGWNPTFISTPVSAGQWNSVALVLDGDATLRPGALTGYLNGSAFGFAEGSQLWSHSGDIGIGAINGTTIFHNSTQNSGAFFGGSIDNFNLYNRALESGEIQGLAN